MDFIKKPEPPITATGLQLPEAFEAPDGNTYEAGTWMLIQQGKTIFVSSETLDSEYLPVPVKKERKPRADAGQTGAAGVARPQSLLLRQSVRVL